MREELFADKETRFGSGLAVRRDASVGRGKQRWRVGLLTDSGKYKKFDLKVFKDKKRIEGGPLVEDEDGKPDRDNTPNDAIESWTEDVVPLIGSFFTAASLDEPDEDAMEDALGRALSNPSVTLSPRGLGGSGSP